MAPMALDTPPPTPAQAPDPGAAAETAAQEPTAETAAGPSAPPPGPPAPPVGWLTAAPTSAPAAPLRIAGATLAVLAGIAGLASAFVPYASYGEDAPFALIPLGTDPGTPSLAFAAEPVSLAGALFLVGLIGFAVRGRLLAGLTLGFGAGLALNHGSFFLSLGDPTFQSSAAIGLYVGLAAGAAALLGGLLWALDRPPRGAA